MELIRYSSVKKGAQTWHFSEVGGGTGSIDLLQCDYIEVGLFYNASARLISRAAARCDGTEYESRTDITTEVTLGYFTKTCNVYTTTITTARAGKYLIIPFNVMGDFADTPIEVTVDSDTKTTIYNNTYFMGWVTVIKTA